MDSIYGNYRDSMTDIMERMAGAIRDHSAANEAAGGDKLYEHLEYRIKGEDSMREKLQRKGLPQTAHAALRDLRDSIGLRVVCLFLDDVYENVKILKDLPGCMVVEEKDYIRSAKPNGYRSYHMILDCESEHPDVDGNIPGHYYVEVQLRTIAMDTWAALEHEMKYKKDISDPELIGEELRRCANELSACDVSMQTLRDLIRE